MGEMPHGDFTIERVNNDGNYEPGNCVWLHRTLQPRNRRCNVMITFHGVTQTAAQWDRTLGFSSGTVSRRTKKGWPPEKATGPVNKALARCQRKMSSDAASNPGLLPGSAAAGAGPESPREC
jgi:hypothetical protein